MNTNSIIEKLVNAALDPKKTVEKTMVETGKKAVGCFPIYAPEELIYAGGFLPVGLWGGKIEFKESEAYYQGFCCSIIKTNVELGMTGAYGDLEAVIIPGLCDTLKCTIENWKSACPDIPCIGMIYPQNRWTTGASEYLVRELQMVRSELEKITGVLISESRIERAWEVYEEYRRTMREFVDVVPDYPKTVDAKKRHLIIKASYFMDKAEYTKDIQKLLEYLKTLPKETSSYRVVTSGLIPEPIQILDYFTECGVSVVADDMAHESRQFRTAGRTCGTVWERLAGRVLDQRGCTFLAEQTKTRGQMLIDMCKEKHADFVAIIMMKFCDPEEFDYPVIKKQLEEAGIPLLCVETDMQMDSFEQIRTRIQGFTEML